MGNVIAFISTHGGSGASTFVVNAAAAVEEAGEAALILDADAQASARDRQYVQPRPGHPDVLEAASLAGLSRVLPRLRKAYPWVLIDAPSSAYGRPEVLAEVADLVVVVVSPFPPDIWAVEQLADVLRGPARRHGAKLALAVTRRPTASDDVAPIDPRLLVCGLPLLGADLTDDALYQEAMASRQTVFELQPEGRAADEVRALREALSEALPSAKPVGVPVSVRARRPQPVQPVQPVATA